MLIEREMYMSRIRPFIGKDVVKVMTGLRRCGKSVMLELVRRELVKEGVREVNFFSYNFEDWTISNLCEATALHDDVCKKVQGVDGKAYLFFDEIQEVLEWEKAINSLRVKLNCDIYITGSNAKLLSSELSTYFAGCMWNLSSIRSLLVNFFRFTISHFLKRASRSVLILLSHLGECHSWRSSTITKKLRRCTCQMLFRLSW